MTEQFDIIIVGEYSGGVEVLEMLAATNYRGRVALVRHVGSDPDRASDRSTLVASKRERSMRRTAKKLALTYFPTAARHPLDAENNVLCLENGEALEFKKLVVCDPQRQSKLH